MNQPPIIINGLLPDFLMDISLRNEDIGHWFRVKLPDLRTILDDRRQRLRRIASSEPNLMIKVRYEIMKQDVLDVHLNRYEELMTKQAQVHEAIRLMKEARMQVDVINLLIMLFDPRPLFPAILDQSNHVNSCDLCKRRFAEDFESYNHITERITQEPFKRSYFLILTEVTAHYEGTSVTQ